MSTSKPVMEIPAKLVKELRELTNAGFSDCRAALVEAAAQLGDSADNKKLIEKAVEILRKKGQAAAAKKATREATEGLIGHYIHAGGKIGVIVEINCESDFVARTDAFKQLCHDVAMHIAAVDPRYVRREDVTPEMLEKEREIYAAQARATGKPDAVIQKIVTGKMEKFYEETCLYEQHFIKDETMTIGENALPASRSAKSPTRWARPLPTRPKRWFTNTSLATIYCRPKRPGLRGVLLYV